MRRYHLREIMAVIAIVAVSLALGSYFETIRRDEAARASRAAAAKATLASRQGPDTQTKTFAFFIGAFW